MDDKTLLQGSIEGLRRQVQAMRQAKAAGQLLVSPPEAFGLLWRIAAELYGDSDVEAARLVSEMASLREPLGHPLKQGQCKGCGSWHLDYCEPWCAAKSNPRPKPNRHERRRLARHAHRGETRRPPNYMAQLVDAGRQLPGPGLYIARVEHDDWCRIWRGGACNCHPDVHEPRPWQG